MTAGFLVARKLDISAGDSAIINSGGLWGTATGALMAQAIFRTPSSSQLGWFILGGTSVGVLTGSLLSWKLELSRGHVGLIDVGGLAGTGLGFALGYVIGVDSGQNEDNIQVGARYALGGMALWASSPARCSRANTKATSRPSRRCSAATTAAGPSASPRSASSRQSRPKAPPRASRSRSPAAPGSDDGRPRSAANQPTKLGPTRS